MDRETREAVTHARKVAEDCRKDREDLRRRRPPGEERREAQLARAIEALHEAMAPIRSAIGRLPYQPPAAQDERLLRATSARLKYERKQIRKMQR